jgi:small ligand-binding sensory domain FIST
MVFPAIAREPGEMPEAARAWIERAAPPFGIVHGDPTNNRAQHVVEGLALATSGFLVGGLTSSRGPQHQLAGSVTKGGMSGVLFAPAVEVATGLSQGCVPLGPGHVITESADNVIMGLDGKRALDVLKADMGELLARDLARASGYVHAAFPVEGSDTGDYLVRNLIGVDPARGWLAVGAEIAAGDRVMFVRRDPKSAIEDLTQMVNNLKSRLPGPPRGGVYFSCVARGPNMFGQEGDEMSLIKELLGDVPLVGFYGNGEISNSRLYGYTGVLALFL